MERPKRRVEVVNVEAARRLENYGEPIHTDDGLALDHADLDTYCTHLETQLAEQTARAEANALKAWVYDTVASRRMIVQPDHSPEDWGAFAAFGPGEAEGFGSTIGAAVRAASEGK